MDGETVAAVLEDWRTAPVAEGLRRVLGFLEKVTLRPDEVTAADVAPVRRAGVGDGAIREALYVAFLFNVLDRLADSLDFELLDEEGFRKLGRLLYRRGYGGAALPG